jgi:PAS domain S-box-containing protein
MEPHLFDISPGRIDIFLLFLVPALINAGIFIYVAAYFPKTKSNAWFSLMSITLALWQASEGFAHLSLNEKNAASWFRISNIIFLLVIPFAAIFVLRFTGLIKKHYKPFTNCLIFLPAVYFFAALEGGYGEYVIERSGQWYWIANPSPGITLSLLFAWQAGGALCILGLLCYAFVIKRRRGEGGKDALTLVAGLVIPVAGGIVAEGVCPLMMSIDDIPVTPFLMTTFSFSSLLAIKRFRLLDYSPKNSWENIVETMNEALLIVNNDDRIMYANPSFCELTGYDFSELKGKIAAELFLEDEGEREKMRRNIEERCEGRKGKYEVMVRTRSGKKLYMHISGAPYTDEKGRVIGSIGIQSDITKLKEYEKSLEYSENRLKQAQAVAHIGNWELDFKTGIAAWSDEACRIYGVPISEKSMQSFDNWLKYIHPDDLSMVKDEIDKRMRTHSDSSFKHRIVRSTGEIRHIHSYSRFEFNEKGEASGLFGVCHDITDKEMTERALAESENRLRTFISESLLSIYYVDPVTKKVVYANRAFCELIGYSEEELRNMQVYDFINHSKDDVDGRMLRVMEDKNVPTAERQWIRKDGLPIHVLVSTFFQNDRSSSIFVAAQDITERKTAELNLVTSNRELETFIYKASHDIRGPLASIMGLVNVSRLELRDELSQKYLGMIGQAATKLDYTLSELVKAMKIKDVTQFRDEIDFQLLIKDVLCKFSHYLGFSKMKLELNIGMRQKYLSSRTVIETILQNLVENSIKYQNMKIESPHLKISVNDATEGIQIIIADNGIGINKSVQPQVYDMYFRGTDSSKGSGLGLYLVKKGIEKLKGSISLKSEEGCGTEFTIFLPNHCAGRVEADNIPAINGMPLLK